MPAGSSHPLISGPLYQKNFGLRNRKRQGAQSAFPIVDVARQHLALADVVGRADDALALHALDDAGGAVVADLQIALDEACAALAFARHERNGLVVELIALAILAALARQA